MSTKELLIELLESNKGEYFSGEEIAAKLSVSRSAVWKAVKTLQSEGYDIDAVTNRGYCLSPKSDILSSQGVKKYLNSHCSNMEIVVLPSVTSTNALVREKAESGSPEGYAMIAGEQSSGRGRLGRSFFSPSGTGLYISLLLRPDNYLPQQAVSLTTIAATAMCEAIESVSAEKAWIKWVNDIFMRGKKVCGILTEASFGLENSLLEYAVVGVGINVYEPQGGFPEELKRIAGSVFQDPQDDGKNRIAAGFLNRFMSYYNRLGDADYVREYRNRSIAVGKWVTVNLSNGNRRAFVDDVDDKCRLIVRYESGETETLSSGEISIKL